MSNDLYTVLGVSRSASDEALKAAYRRIARANHPDLRPDDPAAEARFKSASAAYDLLKNPSLRSRYDAGEIDALGRQTKTQKFYRDTPKRASTRRSQRADAFEDMSDIFSGFVKRSKQRMRTPNYGSETAQKGEDRRYGLTLEFLDATLGTQRTINLPDHGHIEVRIPEGAQDADVLRLSGRGGAGHGGGAFGDALVTLTVLPNPVFARDGDQILIDLPITLSEAASGAQVEVPTIDGPVSLMIPPHSSSGKSLRLRGRGAPIKGGNGARGDQIVRLHIKLPDKPDSHLKKFLTKWERENPYDPRIGI